MASKNERFPRGSFPPYIPLADAINLAEKIYQQGGGKASFDLLSQMTGNSASSSSFVKKLAALRAYGIASIDQAKSEVSLTDAGLNMAAPTNPESGAAAKKEAFLRIDVFSRIYDRHKGKLLPADEFLKNIIEQECQIPRDLSLEWVAALKQGIRAAGLLYDRGDGKMQIMETPIVRFPRTVVQTVNVDATLVRPTDISISREAPSTEVQPTTAMPFASSGHNTKIELSGHRFAVFCIPDTLTIRDAQKIKSAINGISAIVDSMVEEEKT